MIKVVLLHGLMSEGSVVLIDVSKDVNELGMISF